MNQEELNKQVEGLGLGEVLRLESVEESIYHASPGLGSSKMKKIFDAADNEISWQECQAHLNGEIVKESAAFNLGSAVHTGILEPHLYLERYVVQFSKIKTRNGKKWEAFKAKHKGRTILTTKQNEHALAMIRKARSSDMKKFFEGGVAEVSYWCRYDEDTILKARVDYEIGDLNVDLKTTAYSNPHKFDFKACDFGYYIQAALYTKITRAPQMVFCAIGTDYPYPIPGPVIWEEQEQHRTKNVINLVLAEYSRRVKTKDFPDFAPDLRVANLTNRELNRLERIEAKYE